MGLIAFVVVVLLMIRFVYYVARHLQLRERLKTINSPRSYPLIGHSSITKADPEGFINQIMGMAYLYPDSPRMVLLWMGPMPIVMLYSAHLIEKILTSSKHLGKGFAYNLLEPWLGQGIITSNVDNWRPKRKLLTPTFHYDMLKDFVPVFNEQSRILVGKLASLPEREPVELLSFITLCGLDIICETSMGRTINAQLDKESDYVWAVHTINDLVQQRAKNPIMWNDFTYEKFGKGKLEKKCLNILHSFTQTVISERQKELEKSGWRFGGRLAFLDLLLDMAHQGILDSADIQPQLTWRIRRIERRVWQRKFIGKPNYERKFISKNAVDTLMFAGHDTTSTGSSWALYLLGCYPEIQRRVQTEIDKVLGDSHYITVEHLPQLKYLECCLKESLRLYPSVPMIMRELDADQDIGGVILPKGTQLIINQFMVHRDPLYWNDPEDFIPDRFLPENAVKRHPFAFIPFSAGSRNCMGQRFAVMEEKVIVSWILRHFNVISLQKRYNMRTKIGIILRPSDGIQVILEKRRPAA